MSPFTRAVGEAAFGNVRATARSLSNASTVDIFNAAVPDGKYRLILECDGFHGDAASNHTLYYDILAADASTVVQLTERSSKAANDRIVVGRFFIVPEGCSLRLQSTDATGLTTDGGNILQGECLFIELDNDEHILIPA